MENCSLPSRRKCCDTPNQQIMKNTPPNGIPNEHVLALLPEKCNRVVEIGPSIGALAKAYRTNNPDTEYIGIELDEEFARIAQASCNKVIQGSIETLSDADLDSAAPADCWVFSDVLEHLYDPWKTLRRIRDRCRPTDCVVACIPNIQHWTVQVKILTGQFWYEDAGLLDRTHIRFFTRQTLSQMFVDCGFEITEGGARHAQIQGQEKAVAAIRQFAMALGIDSALAEEDSMAYQYVVKAMPR